MATIPPTGLIRFRVGINIGDVIADGTDLHGDGVNVAVRLESACPPGGICVSRAVRDHVHDRLDLDFEELGPLTLKNIARPVHAYVMRPDAIAALPSPICRPWAAAPPAKSAAAAVPFPSSAASRRSRCCRSAAMHPDDEPFADGLTDELINALSRWRSFPVIARNSVFVYRGRDVDVRRIGNELGARYIVSGSVRRSEAPGACEPGPGRCRDRRETC